MDLAAPEWKYLTKTATTTSERNDSIFFFFLGELNQAERLLLACTPCSRPVSPLPLPAQGQNDRHQCPAHTLLVSVSA